MPGLDRYPSMTGWNVVVTPVIRPYDRCQAAGKGAKARTSRKSSPSGDSKLAKRSKLKSGADSSATDFPSATSAYRSPDKMGLMKDKIVQFAQIMYHSQ
eukprot:COSAG02_NODE_2416_length_8909_cov_10.038252_10_plen_99_part_00